IVKKHFCVNVFFVRVFRVLLYAKDALQLKLELRMMLSESDSLFGIMLAASVISRFKPAAASAGAQRGRDVEEQQRLQGRL
ncbi:hypothetical protein, partial [Mesorhizobium sp. M3A.F.Ca.ET.174.01.1.1]|uniref:hypothetical protein n=1 Tax=Mesorhizobium sp. M3A.F.Ca.ET.174.01.1.1 TaxID=2563944 RepID=UPI001AEDD6B4